MIVFRSPTKKSEEYIKPWLHYHDVFQFEYDEEPIKDFFRDLLKSKVYERPPMTDGRGNYWRIIGPFYAKRISSKNFIQVTVQSLPDLLNILQGERKELADKVYNQNYDRFEYDTWSFYDMEDQLGDWQGRGGVSSLNEVNERISNSLRDHFENDHQVYYLNMSVLGEWEKEFFPGHEFAYHEFLVILPDKNELHRHTFSIVV